MLHLLHVLSDPAMGRLQRLIGEHRDNIETRLRQKIDDDLARLCEHLAQAHGVTARCDVVTGTLLPSVLGHADACRADLLVLGARSGSETRWQPRRGRHAGRDCDGGTAAGQRHEARVAAISVRCPGRRVTGV